MALKASPRAEVLAAATLCASGCNPMCWWLQPHVPEAATQVSEAAPLGVQVPRGEAVAVAAAPARTPRAGETGQVRCVWVTRSRAQEATALGSPAAPQGHRICPPHKRPPQRLPPAAHSLELRPSSSPSEAPAPAAQSWPSSTPPPPTDAGRAWASLSVPSPMPATQGGTPAKQPSPPPRTAKGPSRPQSARGAKSSDPLFLYTFTGLEHTQWQQ